MTSTARSGTTSQDSVSGTRRFKDQRLAETKATSGRRFSLRARSIRKSVSVTTRPSRFDRANGSIKSRRNEARIDSRAPIGGFSTTCPSTTS